MAAAIALVVSLSLLAGGLVDAQAPLVCDDPAAYNSAKDYFPDAFKLDVFVGTTIQAAQDFSVQYGKSTKTVFNAKVNETYVLYQCGTPKPTGLPNTTKIFQIPLTSYGTDSTIAVAYLELLGVQGALKALDTTFVTSPCVNKLAESGTSVKLESTFSNATLRAAQEASLNAVVVSNQKANINPLYISFDASSDPGPLKRAEWIKFLALFFNKELEARAIYDRVASLYNCQKQAASTRANKPLVAWVSNFQNVWTITNPAYKLQLITDAGGQNLESSLFKSYNMSVSTEVEAFQAAIKNVDVILDDTYAANPSRFTLANFTARAMLSSSASNPFLVNKRVWRNDRIINANGGLAWFEAALVEPQLVLQDLISIFQPQLATSGSLTFFRNIAANEPTVIVGASNCTRADPASARPLSVVPCPLTAGAQAPSAAQPTSAALNSTAAANVATLGGAALVVSFASALLAFLQ